MNITQKKISKCIGILHRVKYKLGENLKLVLYSTLMLPYLSNCCAIWGNTYISRLNKLIVLQKRAIRLIANVPYLAHTAPLLHKYNCLKLEDLVKFHINNFMYKAYNFDLPCNLQFLFTKTQNFHQYHTRYRQKETFYKKSVCTNIKSMTVSINGVNYWNNLDDNIKLCKNISLFKKNLKKYYIIQYV